MKITSFNIICSRSLRLLRLILKQPPYLPPTIPESKSPDPISTEVNRILAFWFDHDEGVAKWFTPDNEFDNECRQSCGSLVEQARTGKLGSWGAFPDGCLASLILLDQIPRNIFRGLPESYSSDHMALEIAMDAIAKGFDRQVAIDRQMFFYLPFMHGEHMLAQVASLGLFQSLATRTEPSTQLREILDRAVTFSQKHMDVIRDFGRFPSRNESLGRTTTFEEKEYLHQHPSGF